MNVIVYRGFNEQYRWRLVDDEDQMVSMSELMPNLQECLDAAQKVADENDCEVENRVPAPSAEGEKE